MSIYKKLLEVQKEIGAIKKESENPFFKSKYFDINGLLAVVKPVLNKHGVVLLQSLSAYGDNCLSLNTKLVDSESGEIVEDTCPIPVNSEPQKIGSAITYFRRYALQSLLALEAEDDDAEGSKAITYQKPQTLTGITKKEDNFKL